MKSVHHSGFVNIIGRPNAGKSTLMNALVGERMSIITDKPQTTRHRIVGIVSDDNYQVVFSDTPGFIKDPRYEMQSSMNKFVSSTFKDADVMLLVVDVQEHYDDENPLFKKLEDINVPLFLVLNKIDLVDEVTLMNKILVWKDKANFMDIIPISALHKEQTEELMQRILEQLPEGPVYYPKDQFTDRPERFFVSEIIREKILLNYYQEIPYSCEVVVDEYKEDAHKNLTRIHATIYVGRESQKNILIGKRGSSIKQLGIDSRKAIETFIESQVYLELFVKVKDNWRNDDRMLKHFGYKH
ncbi:MAG: GTPase Era [Aureispira sp.]